MGDSMIETVGRSASRRSGPQALYRLWHLFIAVVVALATLATPALADGEEPVGAVYVASNEFSGNRIMTFLRYADGSLAAAGPGVPTGGLGSGPGLLLRDDPLASQHSLIADHENQRLFAVNAGSNDVSVFELDKDGLTLSDRKSSGGLFPVGLALHDDTLYVLNASDHSVAGFKVNRTGTLTHLETCPLPALGAEGTMPGNGMSSDQPTTTQTAGQVGFSPDGSQLVVVSKEGSLVENNLHFPFPPTLGKGRIHVFDVDADEGTLKDCAEPTTTELPANSSGTGKWPFSFTWSSAGHLLVTEIFGASASLGGSSVSSFDLRSDGSLAPISVSVGNGQTATCWIVRSSKHVYTTNFFTDNMSRYEVKNNGRVTLKQSVAASFGPPPTTGPVEVPIDVAVTADGKYLYQLTPGSGQIRPLAVNSKSGALTALPPVADGPRSL